MASTDASQADLVPIVEEKEFDATPFKGFFSLLQFSPSGALTNTDLQTLAEVVAEYLHARTYHQQSLKALAQSYGLDFDGLNKLINRAHDVIKLRREKQRIELKRKDTLTKIEATIQQIDRDIAEIAGLLSSEP